MNAITQRIQRARFGPRDDNFGNCRPDAEFTERAADLILGMEGDQMEHFLESLAGLLTDITEDSNDPAWGKAATALLQARKEINGRRGN